MSEVKADYWLGYAYDRLMQKRMAELYWKKGIAAVENSVFLHRRCQRQGRARLALHGHRHARIPHIGIGSKPTKADIDPLTEQLNKALTFTVTQRSTGKTAEGKFVTAEIEGIYQPTLALRFPAKATFR